MELVDDPEAVRVEHEERDGALVLVLHVAPDDVGKVIGRGAGRARAAHGRAGELGARRAAGAGRDRRLIAALYDVHGDDMGALEAVLREVADEQVDHRRRRRRRRAAPHAAETLERLRALGDRVRWIRGNGDRELTPGEVGLAPPERARRRRSRS